MPDGSERRFPSWWFKRITESGDYLCKRKRNKSGEVGIWTCQGRQTVCVGSTDICAPEEVISEAKLAAIELALATFVMSNAEAAVREHAGVRKVDMGLREVLNIYALSRLVFHDEVINKLEGRYATAVAEKNTELAKVLPFQVKQARRAKANERSVLQVVAQLVEKTWDETTAPKVTEFSPANQLLFVKTCRGTGYADGTIRNYLTRIFTAMNYCFVNGRLLYPAPACMPYESWAISTDEDEDIVVYGIEDLAKLFNAAAEREAWWKYMHLATSGARPMTLIEATWMQVSLEPPRLNLNPPGKRRTAKRRPTIPLCPTLAAEISSWPQDAARIISDGQGKQFEDPGMFSRIQNAAGIKHGTPMSMRKTMRTWLMVNGVPEAIADMFIGHADEGSATGRKHYKAKMPTYMVQAAAAIEKLYDALRPLVTRPFAGATTITVEQQPEEAFDMAMAWLRGNCVAERRVTA